MIVFGAINNQRGFAIIVAVFFMTGFLTLLAFAFDITAMLIKRQELLTMAEMGAAAGGRVVADVITNIANQRIADGEISPPSQSEAGSPELFITPEQRLSLQDDGSVLQAVSVAARDYILKNKPAALAPFNVEQDAIITFPEEFNDCSNSEKKFVSVKISIQYRHSLIMGKLSQLIGGGSKATLEVSGRYNVKLCP